MDRRVILIAGGAVAGLTGAAAAAIALVGARPEAGEAAQETGTPTQQTCLAELGGELWIGGDTFSMGDDAAYPEERPVHQVRVDGFWLDAHEVTNAQYRAFVEATGYVTVAERQPDPADWPGMDPDLLVPGSVVFTPPSVGQPVRQWWSYVAGADWRHPLGPDSSIEGKDHHPVVHVAYEDALAYADWAGRSLPTEAQFELAARSGLDGERFAWGGDDVAPGGVHRANTWQGIFPVQNTTRDGHAGTAPVGCYEANAFGAYDLIGNVWEWTGDWYAPRHDTSQPVNPTGVTEENSYDRNNPGYPVRVLKGGSFLCAPTFCMRYRPAARHAQDTGLGSNHIGFRTVSNRGPGEAS